MAELRKAEMGIIRESFFRLKKKFDLNINQSDLEKHLLSLYEKSSISSASSGIEGKSNYENGYKFGST